MGGRGRGRHNCTLVPFIPFIVIGFKMHFKLSFNVRKISKSNKHLVQVSSVCSVHFYPPKTIDFSIFPLCWAFDS